MRSLIGKERLSRTSFAFALAALLAAANVLAAGGVVQTVKGEARSALSANQHGPLVQGQQLESGTTITTGAGAQVVLRFDDGQQVVLNQNTEFKIAEYSFAEANPAADRSVFDLLKGAARFVTGALGKRSQSAFQLRAPTATIGIRGTDFMVVLVNPLYVSVTQGAVAATNAAGTATFGAGALGSVASATALATPISAAALPAAASSAFSSMSAVTLSAVGGATGVAGTAGGTATGATAAGATAGGAGFAGAGFAIGIGAAAAAGAAASSDSPTTTTHH